VWRSRRIAAELVHAEVQELERLRGEVTVTPNT
jgi:hypothetical protein